MNLALLRTYLNDHLAGSVGGLQLARRAREENADNPLGEFLTSFVEELEDDRATLRGVMLALELTSDLPKQGLAWVGEKLGRFKLNGRLVRYSPLSRLEELEALSLGSEGRLSMWRSLKRLASKDPRLGRFDFAMHIARAEQTRRTLERLRQQASDEAFLEAEEGVVLRFQSPSQQQG